MHEKLPTSFAPAERECLGKVREQNAILQGHFISQTLDALPVIILLLNEHRQIVLANAQSLKVTGASLADMLGKRPGEAFHCIHSHEGPGGCGTSNFCSRCGAVRSIIRGLEGQADIQECSLLRDMGDGVEALDLQVSSSPIKVEDSSYVLHCIQDQSDLKRRRTLERLFFHDTLNTVGGLRGLMDILRHEVPENLRDDASFIHATLAQLMEELLAQKDLLAAENNELTPVFVPLRGRDLLEWAVRMGTSLAQAGGKTIRVAQEARDMAFVSDLTLMKRTLGNMVKNALEASRPGDQVVLSCRQEGDRAVFTVNNPSVMSDDVRLRVFKRNFSTKGMGRGLGTYGMKLLCERYLGGSVSFTSHATQGTTFVCTLPIEPANSGILPQERPPAS